MRRALRVAPRARLDLLDIWEYVVLNSPQRADALLDRIQSTFELIVSQPRMGRTRDEISPGLRSHPVTTYVIFYRLGPNDDAVEIARVLHGARDVTDEL